MKQHGNEFIIPFDGNVDASTETPSLADSNDDDDDDSGDDGDNDGGSGDDGDNDGGSGDGRSSSTRAQNVRSSPSQAPPQASSVPSSSGNGGKKSLPIPSVVRTAAPKPTPSPEQEYRAWERTQKNINQNRTQPIVDGKDQTFRVVHSSQRGDASFSKKDRTGGLSRWMKRMWAMGFRPRRPHKKNEAMESADPVNVPMPYSIRVVPDSRSGRAPGPIVIGDQPTFGKIGPVAEAEWPNSMQQPRCPCFGRPNCPCSTPDRDYIDSPPQPLDQSVKARDRVLETDEDFKPRDVPPEMMPRRGPVDVGTTTTSINGFMPGAAGGRANRPAANEGNRNEGNENEGNTEEGGEGGQGEAGEANPEGNAEGNQNKGNRAGNEERAGADPFAVFGNDRPNVGAAEPNAAHKEVAHGGQHPAEGKHAAAKARDEPAAIIEDTGAFDLPLNQRPKKGGAIKVHDGKKDKVRKGWKKGHKEGGEHHEGGKKEGGKKEGGRHEEKGKKGKGHKDKGKKGKNGGDAGGNGKRGKGAVGGGRRGGARRGRRAVDGSSELHELRVKHFDRIVGSAKEKKSGEDRPF